MTWIQKILLIINIILAIALLGSWANLYISAQDIAWLPFLGLGFPILFILNFAMLVYWAFQLNKFVIISTLAIAINFENIKNVFAWNGAPVSSIANANNIKIMSFNVRDFDLYNWGKGEINKNAIYNLIEAQNPDVLCLQEYYNNIDTTEIIYNTLQHISKELNFQYHYFKRTTIIKNQEWGVVTFSKFPISKSKDIAFKDQKNNCAFYTDIEFQNKTVRMFNMHLQSVHFNSKDYKYLENIDVETDKNIDAGKNIILKLKRAFLLRSQQADCVANQISKSNIPIIVCGDFNDVPSSYVYHTIKGKLHDSFIDAGLGLGKTYNANYPSFRIDYVLLDKSIRTISHTIIDKNVSDHFPVCVEVGI